MNPSSESQIASCGWTNRWKDMMELIVAFHSFVYMPENFIFQDCKMFWRATSSPPISLSRSTFHAIKWLYMGCSSQTGTF